MGNYNYRDEVDFWDKVDREGMSKLVSSSTFQKATTKEEQLETESESNEQNQAPD